jgi:hypothetical protein
VECYERGSGLGCQPFDELSNISGAALDSISPRRFVDHETAEPRHESQVMSEGRNPNTLQDAGEEEFTPEPSVVSSV